MEKELGTYSGRKWTITLEDNEADIILKGYKNGEMDREIYYKFLPPISVCGHPETQRLITTATLEVRKHHERA